MNATGVRPARTVTVIGGGWAGLAAAVHATRLGGQVTLLEASGQWGGRARALPTGSADANWADWLGPHRLDNGQHLLIGAYSATLGLMQQLGVEPTQTLHRSALDLRDPDGLGLAVPHWAQRWRAPWDTLAAIATARGWSWGERLGLLRATARWQAAGFNCDPHWTVERLCADVPDRPLRQALEPLCVSALNTPMARASAQVFLRVLADALTGPGWGPYRAADLLLPRTDLGALLPEAAVQWLQRHGALTLPGQRATELQALPGPDGGTDPASARWRVQCANGQAHSADALVLACPPGEAARLLQPWRSQWPTVHTWCERAQGMEFEAIATVYLRHAGPRPWVGERPLCALDSGPGAPAQFAIDRGALGGPPGLLALVVSASVGDRATLEAQALAQARTQLRLESPQVVQTVVEKRATFACTPGLQRPEKAVGPGLWAAGDHVAGPYPATLESAVRSGLAAAEAALQPAE